GTRCGSVRTRSRSGCTAASRRACAARASPGSPPRRISSASAASAASRQRAAAAKSPAANARAAPANAPAASIEGSPGEDDIPRLLQGAQDAARVVESLRLPGGVGRGDLLEAVVVQGVEVARDLAADFEVERGAQLADDRVALADRLARGGAAPRRGVAHLPVRLVEVGERGVVEHLDQLARGR